MAYSASAGPTTVDGLRVGNSSTDKVGFFGVTPVVQPSGSAQATLTLVTATVSGYGFSTSAAFTAFINQLEEIRATLVDLGLMAGS